MSRASRTATAVVARPLAVRRLVCLLVGVLGLGVVAVGPVPAASGAGQLDIRYGEGGRAVLDWTTSETATLVGSSGPYVAAAVGDRFGLGSFSEYGDPMIAGDGIVTVGFEEPATARGLVDGLLMVGSAGDDFGLVHFGTGGQTDLRFGAAGRQTIDFGGPSTAWDGISTWDTYGWLVVGSAKPGSSKKMALARIDLSGRLLATFGTGGKVLADFGAGDDEARSVATDNDKNLIVAGRSGGAAVVARFTPAGQLDTTFGTRASGLGSA